MIDLLPSNSVTPFVVYTSVNVEFFLPFPYFKIPIKDAVFWWFSHIHHNVLITSLYRLYRFRRNLLKQRFQAVDMRMFLYLVYARLCKPKMAFVVISEHFASCF